MQLAVERAVQQPVEIRRSPLQRVQHGLLASGQAIPAPGQQRLQDEGEGGMAVCQQPVPLAQGPANAVGGTGQALFRG
ncbi:hypothetical protein D3C75_1197080 [compost metagenome]